jgi:hypothetical protein
VSTLAEVEEHRAALGDVVTLAQRDLVREWATIRGGSAPQVRDLLRALLADLVQSYGAVAAEQAALWFEDQRDLAGVTSRFSPGLADLPAAEQVDASARYAVGPLFSATPDASAALGLAAGALQRYVAGGDRDTLELNTYRDPSGPRWSRHASANACTFCRLLATRGAVYTSPATAGEGHRYHDHCHCIAVVSWPGQEPPRAPYVAGWDASYREATAATGGTNTTAVLAHMRAGMGSA